MFLILLLSLLPSPAIYVGMYKLQNVFWTFFLFHGLCLMPAIIWGYPFWKRGIKVPTRRQLRWILRFALGFAALTLVLYLCLGSIFLDDTKTMELLERQGYKTGILIPMTFYFICVNSILEELFWRGLVLTYLDRHWKRHRQFGLIWSSFAYAIYHYFILRLVVYPIWAEIGVVLLFLHGLILCTIYRRSGSLVISTLVHALLTDLTAMLLMATLLLKLHRQLY